MAEVIYKTIDEYILSCAPEIRETLETMKNVIQEAAPEAVQKISWQMPTFYLYGNLVHFAAHKNHIGFYPGASGIEAFQEEISQYKNSKGAVQFPIGNPMPYDLIQRIVKFRVEENIRLKMEKELNKNKRIKK